MATQIVLIVDDEANPKAEDYLRRVRGNVDSLLRDIPSAVMYFCTSRVNVEIPTEKLDVGVKGEVDERHDVLDLSIDNLDIRTMTENALKDRYDKSNIDIKTIGDLTRYSARDIQSLRGIGQKSLKEVRVALAKYDLHLRLEPVFTNIEV